MPQSAKRWVGICGVVVAVLGGAASTAVAQQASADEMAQANNPLADMKAFGP